LNGAPLLVLELHASRALAATILVLHIAAAACIVAVFPGAAGAAIAVLVLALGGAAAWDRALLKGRRSPRALELAQPGEGVLVLAHGERIRVAIGKRPAVNRWWVSLPVRAPMRRSLFIARDMLGREQFRCLRLWALWGRVPGVASGQLRA
jgi:hypothetical protein